MARTRQHQKALASKDPSPGYGQGVALQQAAKSMPDKRAEDDAVIAKGVAAARQRAAALVPQGPPPAPPDVMDMGTAAAAALPPVTGHLNAPTATPGVPVTNGLPSGPGAGPEALGQATAMSAARPIWQALAAATGDPYFTDLARRTGLGT